MSRIISNPSIKHKTVSTKKDSICGVSSKYRLKHRHILVTAWIYVTCKDCLKIRRDR